MLICIEFFFPDVTRLLSGRLSIDGMLFLPSTVNGRKICSSASTFCKLFSFTVAKFIFKLSSSVHEQLSKSWQPRMIHTNIDVYGSIEPLPRGPPVVCRNPLGRIVNTQLKKKKRKYTDASLFDVVFLRPYSRKIC